MSFDKDMVKNHWIESSVEDQRGMTALFDLKMYSYSLFLGHLSVEKLLKALYVEKNSTNAPFTHNLYRLAQLCNLELDNDLSEKLDFITTFNIETRYDDYKKEFYNKCTKEFAENWINNIKDISEWLKMSL